MIDYSQYFDDNYYINKNGNICTSVQLKKKFTEDLDKLAQLLEEIIQERIEGVTFCSDYYAYKNNIKSHKKRLSLYDIAKVLKWEINYPEEFVSDNFDDWFDDLIEQTDVFKKYRNQIDNDIKELDKQYPYATFKEFETLQNGITLPSKIVLEVNDLAQWLYHDYRNKSDYKFFIIAKDLSDIFGKLMAGKDTEGMDRFTRYINEIKDKLIIVDNIDEVINYRDPVSTQQLNEDIIVEASKQNLMKKFLGNRIQSFLKDNDSKGENKLNYYTINGEGPELHKDRKAFAHQTNLPGTVSALRRAVNAPKQYTFPFTVHHLDGDHQNNKTKNIRFGTSSGHTAEHNETTAANIESILNSNDVHDYMVPTDIQNYNILADQQEVKSRDFVQACTKLYQHILDTTEMRLEALLSFMYDQLKNANVLTNKYSPNGLDGFPLFTKDVGVTKQVWDDFISHVGGTYDDFNKRLETIAKLRYRNGYQAGNELNTLINELNDKDIFKVLKFLRSVAQLQNLTISNRDDIIKQLDLMEGYIKIPSQIDLGNIKLEPLIKKLNEVQDGDIICDLNRTKFFDVIHVDRSLDTIEIRQVSEDDNKYYSRILDLTSPNEVDKFLYVGSDTDFISMLDDLYNQDDRNERDPVTGDAIGYQAKINDLINYWGGKIEEGNLSQFLNIILENNLFNTRDCGDTLKAGDFIYYIVNKTPFLAQIQSPNLTIVSDKGSVVDLITNHSTKNNEVSMTVSRMSELKRVYIHSPYSSLVNSWLNRHEWSVDRYEAEDEESIRYIWPGQCQILTYEDPDNPHLIKALVLYKQSLTNGIAPIVNKHLTTFTFTSITSAQNKVKKVLKSFFDHDDDIQDKYRIRYDKDLTLEFLRHNQKFNYLNPQIYTLNKIQ